MNVSRAVARAMRGFAAALLLVAAGIAPAAELIVVEDECRGRQLLIQGAIEAGDHDRFVARMQRLVAGEALPAVQDPDVLWTVKLDSPGGDPAEAMRIGRFLRAALATTEVGYRYARRLDGVWDYARGGDLVCLEGSGNLGGCAGALVPAECTGACLLIWLGGAERFALEGRLGRHGLAADDAAVAAYLADMSAPADLGAAAAGAAGGDGWLSFAERRALAGKAPQAAAVLASCPAPLTADESYASVAAPSAALRDALMDRAEAHRACRHRRLAQARAQTLREAVPALGSALAAGGER